MPGPSGVPMNGLDDLPKRGPARNIDAKAANAFRNAISSVGLFQIQVDQADFGTDYQLEAFDGSRVTNFRVHAQVKGSTGDANADGSVSVSVQRSNLNYLLAQPNSIYVCLHLPTDRLMAAYADEVYHAYEAKGRDTGAQESITVRFRAAFDQSFQEKLSARVLASGRSGRDDRLQWGVTPPDQLPTRIHEAVPLLEVPSDPTTAHTVLCELLDAGQDAVISRAFDRFAAVLSGSDPVAILPAYLAEINLGVTEQPFDAARVQDGLRLLRDAEKNLEATSYHYCVGNGFFALKMLDEARDAYVRAQICADESGELGVSAQASKNLGSVMEKLGHLDAARICYERALELNPLLPEAHWALGLWYGRIGNDPERALDHLEQVVGSHGGQTRVAALSGWKASFLFETGREREAFTELNNLLSLASDSDWTWPWAARLVAIHGKSSLPSANRALRFWNLYLARYPGHVGARTERVLTLWKLRCEGEALDVTLQDYRNEIVELVEATESHNQRAFLWDRLGHWAQWGDDWSAAAEAYRKAYAIAPNLYGYCLGTALNFLGEYGEALPILQPHAEEHESDAMSWFQVGIAQDGLGNHLIAADAFKKAIDLDENYDQAWFNLGGMLWSAGQNKEAIAIWREAVRRFPDHELVERLPSSVRSALKNK